MFGESEGEEEVGYLNRFELMVLEQEKGGKCRKRGQGGI